MPAKPNPATSYGQLAETVVQCSPTCVHTPGIETFRCGSFASNGSPLAVMSPPTTQEFDPIPSPLPSSCGIEEIALAAESKTCCAPSLASAAASPSGSRVAAPDVRLALTRVVAAAALGFVRVVALAFG